MRKTSVLTIASVFACIITHAQISKGSTFLGGSIGYSNGKAEQNIPQQPNSLQESKHSNFSIRPQIGKAIAENSIFGVFLNYSRNTLEQTNGTNIAKTEGNGYGGGIFYRRYYPFSQRFFLFGDAGLGIAFGKGETTSPGGTANFVSFKTTSQQVSLSLTPGLSFAATRKLFLEASLNDLLSFMYGSTQSDSYNQQGTVIQTREEKAFSANANANGAAGLSVGLRWILPSKK